MGLWSRMWGSKPDAEERSLWTRTDGNLLVNDPNQLVWMGSDTLPGLLGQTTEAHRLPAVVRATSLIVSPLSAAPFILRNDATGETLPTPRWIADPQLLRPDGRTGIQGLPHARRLTRSGFWREIVRSAIWHGMGAFIYAVDGQGTPQAGTLRQIHPGSLSVSFDGRWTLGASTAGPVEFDHEGRLRLGPIEYRIAVMRNPLSPAGDEAGGMPLGVFGLSPSAFKTAAVVERYVTSTFTSGVPSGYLKSTQPGLDQTKADHLKERWMAAHGGSERSVAVLPHTVDYTPISFKPVDAEANQIYRQSVGQIAMAFGLPPEVMGVSLANSMTYTNTNDSWSRLRSFGLQTWIDELGEVVSSMVPFGQSVHVDLAEFEITPDREPAEQQTPDAGGQEQ